jgi:photosystem II stability/assembly factor-like uncharacterized protein
MTFRIPFAVGTTLTLVLAPACFPGATSVQWLNDAAAANVDDAGHLHASEGGALEAGTMEDASETSAGDASPAGPQPEAGVASEAAPPVPGASPWVNLDSTRPTSLFFGQIVTRPIGGVAMAIRVDPRSADTVYVATSDGGVWKSTDFTSAAPHWSPLTEGVGLTTSAIDLDPQHPDIVYVGLSDPFADGKPRGVLKSSDGGAHWGALVMLAGTPAVASIQDLMVDPSNSSNVLVATDVGLFRSTDSGASFGLLQLPSASGVVGQKSTFSLAYGGTNAGTSTWMVSGCLSTCQNGDLWRSTDSGATWASLRAVGRLPIPTGDIGRMTVRAARPADRYHTVFYAMAQGLVATKPAGNAVLYRSIDGGYSFTMLPDGPLTYPFGDCNRMSNVLNGYGWSVQAIAIDPTDANHVLFGGHQCSIRTLNGLAYSPQFAVSSDWVGPPGGPPYVHWGWDAATASVFGSVVRVYSATKGGLADSTNVWTTQPGQEASIVWRNDNGGMNTEVGVSVASGDPLSGNPDVVLSGLEDNGYVLAAAPSGTSTFYNVGNLFEVNGAGVAVGNGTSGQFFWAGSSFCSGSASICGRSTWTVLAPALPADDSSPGQYLSAVQTEPSGATTLMTSRNNVWRSDATPAWTDISKTHCDPDGRACTWGSFPSRIRSVFASQTIRGLFGVGFYDNRAAVTSDGESANPTWSISATSPASGWSATIPAQVTGIAFPSTIPAGEHAGDTYVVSTNDGPDPKGHLFVTHDRGRTWSPLSGNGSGADLPNVNARAVRFDPSDTANQTLYAGFVTGIYRTTDGGATWHPLGAGLPATSDIADIYVARDGSFLRVATQGRGLWELRTR